MQKNNFESTSPCICAMMLLVGCVLASFGDSMHKTHKFDIGTIEQVCEITDVTLTSCTFKRHGTTMPPTSRTTNAVHKFNSSMIENVCVANFLRQQGRDIQYTHEEFFTLAKVLLGAGFVLIVAALVLLTRYTETTCPGDDCVPAHDRLECGCPECLKIVKDEGATVREERAKAKEEKAKAVKDEEANTVKAESAKAKEEKAKALKEKEATEASEGWSAQMRFKEAQAKDSTYKGQTKKA